MDLMRRYSRNSLDVYSRRAGIITELDLAAVVNRLNMGKGEMMASEVDELDNCIYRDPGTARLPGRISGILFSLTLDKEVLNGDQLEARSHFLP
jgi:hypothetical protein